MGMKDYETFSQNPCCWLSNTMFAMFVFSWFFGQKSSLQPQIQTKYNSNNIYKLCLLFLGLLVRYHLCNHNYRKNIITLTTAILKYISASAIEYHNKNLQFGIARYLNFTDVQYKKNYMVYPVTPGMQFLMMLFRQDGLRCIQTK